MSACLEANAVLDLVTGAASPVAIAEAESHLDSCGECRTLVAILARDATGARTQSEIDWQATSGAEVVGAGTRIGRYTVLEPIGSGATSVVYVADDPKLDRRVALKLLRVFAGATGDRPASGAQARARLIREARALARVTHPNVVAVHDANAHGELVFVAMEYIHGESLAVWRARYQPSWQQVVDRLCAAARGLAAAHRAGVIHRDCKPANLMVAADGHVKVADFGLAQVGVAELLGGVGDRAGNAAGDAAGDAAGHAMGEDPGGCNITQTGAVLGTPAYMAPEIIAGGPATAASDQYSFAVTLFEMLTGVRPDQDRTALAKSSVPRWLRTIVERGLAEMPGDRFPSMDAMVRALDSNPWRHPWRARFVAVGIALALVVVAGVAGLSAWDRGGGAAVSCDGDSDRWAAVWNPTRFAAVAAGFTADARTHSVATLARITGALERRGRQWIATRAAVCAATHHRGSQSAGLLDIRMACLDDRLREIDAAIGVFVSDLDSQVIDRAVHMLARLPDAAACAAVTSAMAPAPGDPHQRRRLAAVRERLARAWALHEAQSFAAAQAEATAATAAARELARPQLIADALHLAATVAAALGDVDGAEQTAIEAASLAAESGDTDRLARVHTLLSRVVGVHQRRAAEGIVWSRAAQADIAALGGRRDLEADRLRELGDIQLYQGDFAGGIALIEQALAADREAHGPDHVDVANHLSRLGAAERERGDYQAAAARLAESLAILERVVGRNHPALAQPIANLGTIRRVLGDFDEAGRLGERAIQLLEDSYGRDHPHVATALDMLGHTRMRQERYDEARASHRRALAINETYRASAAERARSLGLLANIDLSEGLFARAIAGYRQALAGQLAALAPDHPKIASLRMNLGLSLAGAGRDEEALEELNQALAIWRAKLGPDHDTTIRPLMVIADIARSRGRCGAALAHYQRALAVLTAQLGSAHPRLVTPLGGRGMCLVQLGRHRDAIAALERAIALRRVRNSDKASGLALFRYYLSRALVGASGDRQRARELAALAVEGLSVSERNGRIAGLVRVLRPDEARTALAAARRWHRRLR